MEKKECKDLITTIIVSVVICLVGVYWWSAGRSFGWDKGYAEGVEVGKGQIKEAMTGDIYELKLVGFKDGKVYELEGSYGATINGQPNYKRIPSDAKIGDSVACVRHERGLEIVSRRP